ALTSNICGGNQWNQRLQRWRIRQCCRVLGAAFVRAAKHPDITVAPGLRSYPRDGVVTVRRIVAEESPMSCLTVPTADPLPHKHVVFGNEGRILSLVLECSGVGRANQKCRKASLCRCAVLTRAIDVHRQLDSVTHWNHDILVRQKFVLRFRLRASESSQAE